MTWANSFRILKLFEIDLRPSSVDVDRVDKFEEYCAAGVENYWMIDPELRTIDAWRLQAGQHIEAGRAQGIANIRLHPFPELEIPLSRLWRETQS